MILPALRPEYTAAGQAVTHLITCDVRSDTPGYNMPAGSYAVVARNNEVSYVTLLQETWSTNYDTLSQEIWSTDPYNGNDWSTEPYSDGNEARVRGFGDPDWEDAEPMCSICNVPTRVAYGFGCEHGPDAVVASLYGGSQ